MIARTCKAALIKNKNVYLGEPSDALLVGMQAGAAILENSVEFPQKVKKQTTLRPSNLSRFIAFGIYPKSTKILI